MTLATIVDFTRYAQGLVHTLKVNSNYFMCDPSVLTICHRTISEVVHRGVYSMLFYYAFLVCLHELVFLRVILHSLSGRFSWFSCSSSSSLYNVEPQVRNLKRTLHCRWSALFGCWMTELFFSCWVCLDKYLYTASCCIFCQFSFVLLCALCGCYAVAVVADLCSWSTRRSARSYLGKPECTFQPSARPLCARIFAWWMQSCVALGCGTWISGTLAYLW